MSWAQITLSRLAISVCQGKRDRAHQGKGQSRPQAEGPRCCQESPLTTAAWPGQSQGADTQPKGCCSALCSKNTLGQQFLFLTTPLSKPSILHPHPESSGALPAPPCQGHEAPLAHATKATPR